MLMPKSFTRILVRLSILTLAGIVIYRIGYVRGIARVDAEENIDGSEERLDNGNRTAQSSLSEERILPRRNAENKVRTRPSAPTYGWQAGFDLAATDLDQAIARAESLPYHQQIGYVTGVFSYLAENRSPSDALKFADVQEGRIRQLGLKTLVAEWMLDGGGIEDENEHWQRVLRYGGGLVGLEAGLTSFIAEANLDPSIEAAWREAFANHPSRSEIAARFAASRASSNPDFALEIDDRWTDWEKERFRESVIENWSRNDPAAVWDWYTKNDYGLSRPSVSSLFSAWAQHDPKQLGEAFHSIESPKERARVIDLVTSRLSTFEALDWAESLPDPQERAYAAEAAHKKTLTGIGAYLQRENGYAKIISIIPGGALENSTLRPGDLLIEARESNQNPVNLYGRHLGSIIGSLRGEYGTTVELRVLRPNESAGNLEEHSVSIERGLILPEDQAVETSP